MRILAIDIEGGHGGSSRSLFQMLRAMDRAQVEPEVWCRRGGAIEGIYGDIGVPVRVAPEMPRLTALKRNSRNLVDVLRFFFKRWPQSKAFRLELSDKLKEIDLLHLNHISLFWLARWIHRKHPTLPITMHIRTRPGNTIVARWQARTAVKVCSQFVFITEHECDHMAHLLGEMPKGQVIYNPVEIANPGTENDKPTSPLEEQNFIALCLSNFAYVRGLDRLIEVAKHLDLLQDNNIKFVIAGDIQLTKGLQGGLGRIARAGGTLADYAQHEGVAHRFTFLGHVSDPESLLMRADILLKPTREDNPWGRDILEALGHGVPVASVGNYDRFVESDHTGLLQTTFDAPELATWLIALSNDRERLSALRNAGISRVANLCDPAQQASKLVRFWRATACVGGVTKESTP